MTERAKLYQGALAAVAVAIAAAACASTRNAPTPSYDPVSRRLLRLDSDLNGNGAIDQRTYMDGNRPLRSEIDTDGDGRVDRWEYLGARAELLMVGTSSRADGVEDMWTGPADPSGQRRVDISRRRDRVVDRREIYINDRLTRAEEDTNGDGLPDKWEAFDGSVLRQVALDTRLSAGRADRRLLYDAQGRFIALEADPDGDGQFVVIPGAQAPDLPRRP